MAEYGEVGLSFGSGEDHVTHETRIPEGFARRVVNWDLDDTGVAYQRPTLEVEHTTVDCHSMWRNPASGVVYVVADEKLSVYEGGLVEPLPYYLGGAVQMYGSHRVYFNEFNGIVYFTNGLVHGVVRSDGYVYPWGCPNNVPPVRDETATHVRYLTYVDMHGQESGAVRFDTGTPHVQAGFSPRLYWADNDSTQYRRDGQGKALETQGKVQFPPGRFIERVGGRIYTVRGSKVYYSEPLNPGLIDPRYNYVDVGSRVTAIAAVHDGLYVGTTTELIFFRGTEPTDFIRVDLLGQGVVPGGVCRVPAAAVPTNVVPREGERYIVAFLTQDGIVYCMSQGSVRAPDKARVKLPLDIEVRMDLVEREGYYQLVAIPTGVSSAASMAAVDSPVQPIEV